MLTTKHSRTPYQHHSRQRSYRRTRQGRGQGVRHPARIGQAEGPVLRARARIRPPGFGGKSVSLATRLDARLCAGTIRLYSLETKTHNVQKIRLLLFAFVTARLTARLHGSFLVDQLRCSSGTALFAASLTAVFEKRPSHIPCPRCVSWRAVCKQSTSPRRFC
jgi:hypothetical protein